MSDPFDPRTPRRPVGPLDPGRKRSAAVAVGVLSASLVGGYGLMSGTSCKRAPEPGTPEALALDPESLAKAQQEYEQCRRRRTASSSSRSRSRSLFSSGSSRSSVSRGGFGRSGSFGG